MALMWYSVKTKTGRSTLVKGNYRQEAIQEAMERFDCERDEIDETSVVAVERFHRNMERRTLDGKRLTVAYR